MKKRKKPHKNCIRDQSLSFCTRHHPCKQGVAFAGTRQLRLQGPVPVHAHRTEGVTGSGGREGANGVGGGIGDGNRVEVGGRNGDVNADGDGGGAGAAAGTRVQANEGAQDGDENGSEDGMGREREWGKGWRPVDEHMIGTGTGAGTETRAVAKMRAGTRITTGTGTRKGSRRAEERRRSARNRTRVKDAMWETGETRAEREKSVYKKGLVQ